MLDTKNGGSKGTRTLDPLRAKQVLSQLSYGPTKLVPKAGIEPARYCYHRILSPARLPIPPLRHFARKI